MPDFSTCGYRGGGVALPEVPVLATLSPAEGEADDTDRIQAAIDAVGAATPDAEGRRGTVLIRAGIWRVAGTLHLRVGGVVLRGEGPGHDGTLVIATGTGKRPLILIDGGRPPRRIDGTGRAIADRRVPLGAHRFALETVDGLAVGDDVEVHRPATAGWLATLGVDRLNRGPDDRVTDWTPEAYGLGFERRLTAIDGRTVTIDAPVVLAMERSLGGGTVHKLGEDERIREVGVERLRLISAYNREVGFEDEDHAWDAVKVLSLADGWVRDVTALHFGYGCVNLGHNAKRITVQDCAMVNPKSRIHGGRRYSFAVAGQRCLVQRCYTRSGRHDYVLHARVRGPNVFLDCVAERTHSDSGPHHRFAVGVLFDNLRCGDLNVQWRGRSGTGHGWAGANMVFWNCRTRRMDVQKPPLANNFAIGCAGELCGDGHIESAGTPVAPRSLYLAQLAARLGPAAVDAVTTPAQCAGILDDRLAAKHRPDWETTGP